VNKLAANTTLHVLQTWASAFLIAHIMELIPSKT